MNDSKKPQAIPTGPERELQIYALGLSGGKPSVPVPLDLLEKRAKEILAPQAYDYVAGGAGGEDTMRANREAFYRWRIVPRMLRDVSKRDLSVEVLGARLPAPVLLAPVGVQEIVHDDADVASARAAASLGLPFVLSTMSSRSIEEVVLAADKVAESPRWFQLYWGENPELTASMLQRAERAGYSALVVTLDTHSLGWRERDLQHGYLPFMQGQGLANYFSDPAFRALLAQPPEQNPMAAIQLWGRLFSNPALTWKDIGFLRQHTRVPIILKGILHANDAGTGARCRRGCDHRVESRGAAGGWRHWCTRCAARCGVRGERPCARVVRQQNSSWGGRFQGAGAGRASGVAWPALHVGPRGGGRSGRAGCFAESSCRFGLNDGAERIHLLPRTGRFCALQE